MDYSVFNLGSRVRVARHPLGSVNEILIFAFSLAFDRRLVLRRDGQRMNARLVLADQFGSGDLSFHR